MRLGTLKSEIKLQTEFIRMGIFSFGKIYRRIYVRKSSLRLRPRVAAKLNFRPYIRRYTSQKQLSPKTFQPVILVVIIRITTIE